jgi:hypothetical protein
VQHDAARLSVVPEGTEALVLEVLTNAALAASADDIVAQVLELMPQPQGNREVPFEPRHEWSAETSVRDGRCRRVLAGEA